MEREGQREETLATPGVLEKYQAAGKIANRKRTEWCTFLRWLMICVCYLLVVLEKVIEKVVVGAKIVDVCDFGDKLIDAEVLVIW